MAFGLDKNRSNGAASQDALPTLEALEPRLLLAGDFAVTVTPIYTFQTRSWFQGTVEDIDGDRATLEITISNAEGYSETYAEDPNGLVNNDDGTWEMTWNHIAALAPGDYDVAISATRLSGTVTDDTTYELHIDLTPPQATVDSLVTNDTTPELTGTFEDNYPGVTVWVTVHDDGVIVDGNELIPTIINGNTWSVPNNGIAALGYGVYDISLEVEDQAGWPVTPTFNNVLTIMADPPVNFEDTIFPLTTDTRTHSFNGDLDDPTATVEVTISKAGYSATYSGDGDVDDDVQIVNGGPDSAWFIIGGTIDPLNNGVYDLLVTATYGAGNKTSQELIGGLTITGPPIVGLDEIAATDDPSPELTGTVMDISDQATIIVTINGVTYIEEPDGLINNTDGTWTLPAGTITPDLEAGTYDVTITATNDQGEDTHVAVDGLVIDISIPIVTVNTLFLLPGSPALSGTVNDPDATIEVTIGGATYDENDVTVDNDGNWTLPAGKIAPDLVDGNTYDVVVTATDDGGKVGTVEVDVIVDVIPVVTVDATITNDTRPELKGTVNAPAATVTLEILDENDVVVVAIVANLNKGDGTWVLANDAILEADALADGTYEIRVEADNAGDIGNGTGELIIDQVPPVVTVEDLITDDTTPGLTGTVVDGLDVSIAVTIAKTDYTATYTSGDGDVTIDGTNWTISDNVIAALASGSYVVSVVATDAVDNVSETIEADLHIAPIVTVDDLITADQTPQLTGKVFDLPGNRATVRVTISIVLDEEQDITVDLATYVATNNLDNTWTLADGRISPALDPLLTYRVSVTGENGEEESETVKGDLEIDLFAPLVTIESLSTVDTTPGLTGTIDDNDATVTVEIWQEGALVLGGLEANNNNGTWTLGDNVIDPALAEGIYTVKAIATDELDRVTTTNGTLEINLTPDVKIDDLETNDTTPQLTGTVNDPDAVITLDIFDADGVKVVDGIEANNNGDGTWELADGDIPDGDLVEGTYDVTVTATNGVHVGTDTGELIIETTAPAITVDPFGGASADRRPAITGTVDDGEATVTVTIDGQAYTAVVDEVADGGTGLFGWTVEAETIPAPGLINGTYTVSVSASDEFGNIATDDTVGLTIAYLPTITVDELVTSEVSPQLTGTVEDDGDPADITVTINGNEYTAQRHNDGTWTLDTIAPFVLADDGVYNVIASATNSVGTIADDTTGELTIDRAAPTVTVNPMTTTDTTPTITGTVNDPDATVTVTVYGNETDQAGNPIPVGQEDLAATVNPVASPTGLYTWEVQGPQFSAAGEYEVEAEVTDAAGNSGTDATTDELIIVPEAQIIMAKVGRVRRLRFWDTDGTWVNIALKDSRQWGSVIIYLGSNSPITDTADHFSRSFLESDTGIWISSIQINGTNKVESLIVKTKGGTVKGTTIGLITGTGVLGNLSAKTSELQGVTMANGVIQKMKVRNLTGLIYMGATDTKSIKMAITEKVIGANIIITGTNVSSFTAGAMIDSSLYVGVIGPQALLNNNAMPNVIDLQDGFSIGKVNIKGYRNADGFLFVNSNIAARKIKSVKLKDPRLNNNGNAFGITAAPVKKKPKLSFKLGKTNHRFKNGIWSPADLGVSDLEVRLV